MVVVIFVMMEVVDVVAADVMVAVGSGGCDGEELISMVIVVDRCGKGGDGGGGDGGGSGSGYKFNDGDSMWGND
ncbi:hypothetical protein HAX54_024056 [Datura stramonium]|uniref:Uncharacterized protein n=1 Tax=Datura stramonium TaxID=4076 RepID=A0ABS8UXA5_DATST|nr:hypothetical protein [Datura stramonium]